MTELVRTLLVSTLPDLAKEIDVPMVEGVVDVMQRNWNPAFEQLGVSEAPQSSEGVEPGEASGYLVRATHSRLMGAGKHEFTEEVPMMRVRLPEKQVHVIADTPIGQVVDGDHKLYSLEIFREYYQDYLPAAARVDLITPVRHRGHRFAAVAIYLVYPENSSTPEAFIFEAGMATGKPMVLYASKDMKTIKRKSGYVPTPFASVDHSYLGSLVMDGDDPRGFTIEIRKDRDDPEPFFCLSATMEPRDDLKPVHPLLLTLQAALRVCAIADARGEEVPDLGPLTGVLAPLGRELSWKSLPGSGDE